MDDDWPFVSVIMPVLNEADFIERSIYAVLEQDYPPDRFEVLVVDGGSDDGTRELVERIAASDPRVQLLDNPKRIVPVAMNIGIRRARGEIIVRVDGHTIIAPDYIRICVRDLRETGAVNVGGPMRPKGITPMGMAIAAAARSPFGVPARFHYSAKAGYVDTVYMGAWPKEALERVGGFDESLVRNQDYELNFRLRKAGGRIYYDPRIRSEYYGRQSLGALWRQYFQYGVWKAAVLAKHPDSVRPRHLAAPALVAGLVFGAIGAPFCIWGRALLAIVGVSYVLALLIASVLTASCTGWDVLVRLPLAFATMHIAWGCGFWTGVIREVIRACMRLRVRL